MLHFETVPVDHVIEQMKRNRPVVPRNGNGDLHPFRGRKSDGKVVKGKRVLSLSYDVALLESRQMLLEDQGYSVTSVVGLDAAVDACKHGKFDLVILGHSIPAEHKRRMLEQLRAVCKTPVLALQRSGESYQTPGAEYTFDPIEGPRAFVAAVNKIMQED